MGTVRSTFQHRLFSDEELPHPTHDRIARWAQQTLSERPHVFLSAVRVRHVVDDDGRTRAWADSDRHGVRIAGLPTYGSDHLRQDLSSLLAAAKPPLPTPPEVRVGRVSWQEPLKNGRGTVFGAADLLAKVLLARPTLVADVETRDAEMLDRAALARVRARFRHDTLMSDGKVLWASTNAGREPVDEPALVAGLNWSVCRGDKIYRLANARWEHSEDDNLRLTLLIEAEVSIRSASELLRKLNFFRTAFEGNCVMAVVAPAEALRDDMEEILSEQRVGIVRYLANG